MKSLTSGAAVLVLLGVVTSAGGATLYSPPVVPNGNQSLLCSITNVSTKPILLEQAVALDDSGAEVGADPGPFTLAPGATVGGGPAAFGSGRLCRFRVKAGSKKVRASVCVVGTLSPEERYCLEAR